jgi:hypothetical protein
MYNSKTTEMCRAYNEVKNVFVQTPDILMDIEGYVTEICCDLLSAHYSEFESDYNEASYTRAFWHNYPPEDRGRSPIGDQIPWIEVGEHSIGHKLKRLIASEYRLREPGLPSGADNRFLLYSNEIARLSGNITDCVMVFLDIKSVGPRDDFEHTVISPYQVSSDGIWDYPDDALVNTPMTAVGRRASHMFQPAIAPIYVFSDGTIAPTIHVFVKPVYNMLGMNNGTQQGQPLQSIRVICVPNGLLLTINPDYLNHYPGLFFPGKDDKSKPASKVRCRVSFPLLSKIDEWRICKIESRNY